MSDVSIIILMFLGLLLALFLIPRFMIKRALKAVLRSFRQNVALNERTAKTLDELDLGPASRRMFGLRDYRPAALQALVSAEIIRLTEDGRLYLSEDALVSTGLEQRLQ